MLEEKLEKAKEGLDKPTRNALEFDLQYPVDKEQIDDMATKFLRERLEFVLNKANKAAKEDGFIASGALKESLKREMMETKLKFYNEYLDIDIEGINEYLEKTSDENIEEALLQIKVEFIRIVEEVGHDAVDYVFSKELFEGR